LERGGRERDGLNGMDLQEGGRGKDYDLGRREHMLIQRGGK